MLKQTCLMLGCLLSANLVLADSVSVSIACYDYKNHKYDLPCSSYGMAIAMHLSMDRNMYLYSTILHKSPPTETPVITKLCASTYPESDACGGESYYANVYGSDQERFETLQNTTGEPIVGKYNSNADDSYLPAYSILAILNGQNIKPLLLMGLSVSIFTVSQQAFNNYVSLNFDFTNYRMNGHFYRAVYYTYMGKALTKNFTDQCNAKILLGIKLPAGITDHDGSTRLLQAAAEKSNPEIKKLKRDLAFYKQSKSLYYKRKVENELATQAELGSIWNDTTAFVVSNDNCIVEDGSGVKYAPSTGFQAVDSAEQTLFKQSLFSQTNPYGQITLSLGG